MSKIKVNSIVNRTDTGGPSFIKGAKVPSGQVFSVQGGVSVAGIATANSFSGDGSLLTNLAFVTLPKTIAYKMILGFDEYRA
jgi:hypothetical protein